MRTIQVRVGDAAAAFTLLEDDAPRTTAAMWDSLPIEGRLTHARWAGPAVWIKTPNAPISSHLDVELPVTSIYPGTMVVRGNPNGVAEIFLAYGAAESRGPTGRTYATPVAELDGDGAELMDALARTWREGSVDVIITQGGADR